MPSVVTYPKYSIVSGDRTTLIHEGTICGSFSTEACVEVLPYDGKFVFRGAGYAEDPSKVSWDFCGESGILGEEVQFKMVKGKCVLVEKRSATDYCLGIESISVWSGSVLLLSSSPYSSSSLGAEDSKVLERTLSEVLFHSEVHVDSMVVGEEGLTVSFTSLIVLEKLGYVGVYSDEAEEAEEFIETSMENAVSGGAMFASFKNILYSDPSLSSKVVGQTTSLALLGFEMTSLSYRTKVSSDSSNNGNSNGNGNNNGKDVDDNGNGGSNGDEGKEDSNSNGNGSDGDGVMDELGHFSFIGYLSGAVALVLIVGVLFVTLRSSLKSSFGHEQANSDEIENFVPENSQHSLLESNLNASKFGEDEVFRFR